MYDRTALTERLEAVLKILRRIPRRFSEIHTPMDFENSDEGLDRLDAICMALVAAGEACRQIDDKTNGEYLDAYPEVDWRGVIGVRNVIAHGYFDMDAEQVFNICEHDVPVLINTVEKMLKDLKS